MRTTENLDEFRSALAVLLPAKVGLTLGRTAEMLGVGTVSSNRMQARIRLSRTSVSGKRNWGGRRRSLLTPTEEVEFLRPWAERVGHQVKASVVWRLLARHGWRKVAPDTRHPKNDPQVMQACKKNSPRSREALLCRRAV